MDAGSSLVCDILEFLASLERRQQARDGCWDMPKASSAPKMRILLSSTYLAQVPAAVPDQFGAAHGNTAAGSFPTG
jgi:hypothetical protein